MNNKSDIEAILESQDPRGFSNKILSPVKPKNSALKPLLLIPPNPKVRDSPIEQLGTEIENNFQRKSLLAIPLVPFTRRITTLITEEEINLVKIPTFTKSPFGVHTDMLAKCPTFEILPRGSLHNYDSIKAIKLESGRIKKTIANGTSNALFKIKKKFRRKKPTFPPKEYY